ncbi:Double Clp-N motif-containing P-loop nucleoside triphosphate hydrolases superfamily protein [Rhynchospora pubera]|uniref:Double Clp-N motif-containing P-loop nucleoside triphosphate hydrolases superfamily protein n=1 Tax=Rhynchospora pubera TaxID=906938 RepID=A0AAV8HFS0_9POAL|nr:Double Clp-N motif-containing P-loop nucleoside triphosphate hydrolases superfamily protein [Rhynchospora pubera]
MRAPPAPAEQLTSAMTSMQQSFTTDASAVLTAAVSDASRRHHPHVTPVHVAAALLSAPSSLLRRTCMMHQEQHQHRPTHPFLSCRALDLCFSVALDRMASIPSHLSGPVFSNALVASLKRAQAIQRRGSPDHPLLAIRVDLPHLTISILDDPSVSRVMGEAGFSSPRVKSSILSYINPKRIHGREIGLAVSGYRQEIKRVADVLMRQQKRNPVLVGDTGVDFVMEDILGMMRRGDFGNLNVVSVGDSLSRAKTNELPGRIRGIVNTVSFKLLHDKGVVLDLGDLKWLVEAQNDVVLPKHTMEERRQTLMATARTVISEVASILRQERRMWVVGTATCATYLKCQVYHPNMERDWDLQALPITPRSLVGVWPSFDRKGIPGSSVEALNTSNNHASSINNSVMPLNWNREKPTAASRGSPGSCSFCLKQHGDESSCVAERHQLEPYNSPRANRLLDSPLFLQKEETLNETTIEVGVKWKGPSLRIQHQLELVPISPGSISSTRHRPSHSEPTVQTDLSLRLAPFSATKLNSDWCGDAESQISLSEGLSREVNWQPDAAASISSALQGFNSGIHKRCGCNKSAIWLLFNGPDDIGKRKMAHALSMLVFREMPATFNLSPKRDNIIHEQSMPDCGRTQLDLLVEAVKANPMRVIVLDGVDQADAIVRTTIKNAIMTGRFVDSDDQEIGGLGGTIFILIVGGEQARQEMKPLNWRLELSVGPNIRKRRAEHEQHGERRTKPRTVSQPISLDLNLCAGSCLSVHDDDDEDNDDGDSDLTEENVHNIGQCTEPSPVPSSISDIYHLLDLVTDFKPFDPSEFKLTLSKIMSAKFALVMGTSLHLEIEMHVLDHIADVVLHSDGILSFEQWVDKVFVPVVEQLKSSACIKDGNKIYLSVVKDWRLSGTTSDHGTQLPISVTMTLDAT